MIDHKLLSKIKADADVQNNKNDDRTDGKKKKWVNRTSTVLIVCTLFIVLLMFAMSQGIDSPTETLVNIPPTEAQLESEYAEFLKSRV